MLIPFLLDIFDLYLCGEEITFVLFSTLFLSGQVIPSKKHLNVGAFLLIFYLNFVPEILTFFLF